MYTIFDPPLVFVSDLEKRAFIEDVEYALAEDEIIPGEHDMYRGVLKAVEATPVLAVQE